MLQFAVFVTGSSHGILCTDAHFWFVKVIRNEKKVLISRMLQVGGRRPN
jgi:hypothetical protein